MTKEKLYGLLLQESRYSSSEYMHFVKKYLDEFFESNVCIPKAENRHPYADVLHEWVEDISKVLQYSEHNYSDWYRSGLMDVPNYIKLRIKPSEPVYLYRFTYQDYDGTVGISDYLSEKDAIISLVDVNNVSKLEWTKKEKQ